MLRIRDLGINVIPAIQACGRTTPPGPCVAASGCGKSGCGKSKPPGPKKYANGVLGDDAVARLRQQLNDAL